MVVRTRNRRWQELEKDNIPLFLSPDSDVLDAKLCSSYVCIVSNMGPNNS
jgi:hypothetical protein